MMPKASALFRSEFLYLENSDYPTEDQQFEAYKQAAEALQGKTVVIRTLDIGADKKVDYFDLDPERKSGYGHACHPYLPESRRFVQDTASRLAACLGIR